jgi:hypothetical protein
MLQRSTFDRLATTCGAAGGCGDLQQHELIVAVLEEWPCVDTLSRLGCWMAVGAQCAMWRHHCHAPSSACVPHVQGVIWYKITWDVHSLLRAQLRPVPAQVEAVDECQAL